MDALLVNPPVDVKGGLFRQYKYEHLGLAYLAAVLREDGYEVGILDANLEELDVHETFAKIISAKPKLIGLTVFLTSHKSATEIVGRLRDLRIQAHIVMGGHYPTFCYQELLRTPGAPNSIIRGEGEWPLRMLMRAIERGQDWRQIPNLAYGTADGTVANPTMSLIANLDDLPFPSRDSFPLTKQPGRRRGISISSSRGCEYACSYCSISSFYRLATGKCRRERSAKNVADEVEFLSARFNFDYLHFHDDRFVGSGAKGRQRAYDIGTEFIRRGFKKPFVILSRPDDVESELFALLKQAGLERVELGVEAGVQSALDLYKKGTTVADIDRGIQICKDLSIDLLFFFILFNPYSTLDDLVRNFQFMKKHGLDNFSMPFASLEFLPGTPIIRTFPREHQRSPGEDGYCCLDDRAEALQKAMLAVARQLNLLLQELYDTLAGEATPVYEAFDQMAKQFQADLFEGMLNSLRNSYRRPISKQDLIAHAVEAVTRFSTDYPFSRNYLHVT